MREVLKWFFVAALGFFLLLFSLQYERFDRQLREQEDLTYRIEKFRRNGEFDPPAPAIKPQYKGDNLWR